MGAGRPFPPNEPLDRGNLSSSIEADYSAKEKSGKKTLKAESIFLHVQECETSTKIGRTFGPR